MLNVRVCIPKKVFSTDQINLRQSISRVLLSLGILQSEPAIPAAHRSSPDHPPRAVQTLPQFLSHLRSVREESIKRELRETLQSFHSLLRSFRVFHLSLTGRDPEQLREEGTEVTLDEALDLQDLLLAP